MTRQQGSEYDRLFYPYLFEGSEVAVDSVLAQVQTSTMKKCQDIIELRQKTLALNLAKIAAAGKAMAEAFATGATLFAFGNGGSATDAQDIVADIVNPPFKSWKSFPALSITNDIAVVTAVGNDVGFENVFSRQIIALGRKGDIAFGISTSGNSRNVILALDQAKKQGLLTVTLAGYDGGEMAKSQAVDYCMISPSEYIPRIQEAQATVYHALLEVVQEQVETCAIVNNKS